MISRHDIWHDFPMRSLFCLFCAALLTQSPMFRTGMQGACQAAEPVKVEQAGDHFVNFVLALDTYFRGNSHELEFCQKVRAGGNHLVVTTAGGQTVGKEALKLCKRDLQGVLAEEFVEHFTVQNAKSNDVVLLGFENEKEERLHLASHVKQLLSDGALIVFFGSDESAKTLRQKFGHRDNLLFMTHDVPNGGIIEVPGWPERICSGRSIVNFSGTMGLSDSQGGPV